MTMEQKVKWLEDADNVKVLNQFKQTVIALTNGSIAKQIEASEDYELVIAEILKRMR